MPIMMPNAGHAVPSMTPSKSLNMPVLNNGARMHDANANLTDVMRMLAHINESIAALAKAIERIDRRTHDSDMKKALEQQMQRKA
jgi:hypothetical protein